MKQSQVTSCITMDLLLFVRDSQPTESELLERLGPAAAGRYHTLRKAGLLLLQDGIVILHPDYLTPDGTRFYYNNLIYEPDLDKLSYALWRDRPWLTDDRISKGWRR